eukprot:7440164-Heterocapsa_arctica.AAC.1
METGRGLFELPLKETADATLSSHRDSRSLTSHAIEANHGTQLPGVSVTRQSGAICPFRLSFLQGGA